MPSVLRACRVVLIGLALCGLLAAGDAWGQFTTIRTIPPDANIGNNRSVGSDTQINLFDGGQIGFSFDAGSPDGTSVNIEVNIAGGFVGSFFDAWSGSEVNISGGTVDSVFDAESGSVVNVSGGRVVRLDAESGSNVNISGGRVDIFFANSGSRVKMSGGEAGNGSQAKGNSVVDISGGLVGSVFRAFDSSTVNISGGMVADSFDAFDGSTVNIMGGSVGSIFEAFSGSVVNITGGTLGERLSALNGSVVNILGGAFGDYINGSSGSTVTISGGEYRLDGLPIAGLDTVDSTLRFNVPANSVLSGTLADGTPFAVSGYDRNISGSGDKFADGVLKLTVAELPAVGPTTITLPSNLTPRGVRNGQMLVVEQGGMVADNFNAGWGSTVVVAGGRVANNFEAVGAQVTISSGNVGDGFDAFSGSVVTIAGGTVGKFFEALDGSVVNISGGTVESGFDADSGSVVNITAGVVGNGFEADDGSVVNISGGTVGDNLTAKSGATVNIFGGTVGSSLIANSGSVVNISQGTVGGFFTANGGSVVNIMGGTVGAFFEVYGSVNISGGEVPVRARNGSVVNISGGIVKPSSEAHGGSEVNISGGSVSNSFQAYTGSVVKVSGGSMGDFFRSSVDSTVTISGGEYRLDGLPIAGLDTVDSTLGINVPANSVLSGTLADGTPFAFATFDSNVSDEIDRISDGTLTLKTIALPEIARTVISVPGDSVPMGIRSGQTLTVNEEGALGDNFNAGWGSTVVVAGGQVGDNFEAVGANVTISGGSVGDGFDAFRGSVVNISGGTIGSRFQAWDGSVVNLFGTEFILDDVDITATLTGNVPFSVVNRNVRVRGKLADGSYFSFTPVFSADYFSRTATLTLTLVLPGDFDFNGVVDAADYVVWRNGLGSKFTQNDYNTWKANFGRTAGGGAKTGGAVPEPRKQAGVLATVLVVSCWWRRGRLSRPVEGITDTIGHTAY